MIVARAGIRRCPAVLVSRRPAKAAKSSRKLQQITLVFEPWFTLLLGDFSRSPGSSASPLTTD
jgi:hypothetical protein